jgi:O-acetyl-ADP-ribose deacetylase (regulator of RNase III)
MIRFMNTDLFTTDADALVNTVNCVGAMGRGIAAGVKDRWPLVYFAYRRDCGIGKACNGFPDGNIGPQREQSAPPCCAPGRNCPVHKVRPGQVIVRETGTPREPLFIVDVPTKRHWHGPSLIGDVEVGVHALARTIEESQQIKSIAVPPLGCGNGGLDWRVVRMMLVSALRTIDCDIRIHAPG